MNSIAAIGSAGGMGWWRRFIHLNQRHEDVEPVALRGIGFGIPQPLDLGKRGVEVGLGLDRGHVHQMLSSPRVRFISSYSPWVPMKRM